MRWTARPVTVAVIAMEKRMKNTAPVRPAIERLEIELHGQQYSYLMGGNGPRNYLIEQVNPAELRAGGGFIGSYSILRADHGALTMIKSSGDAYDLMGSDSRPRPGMAGYVKPPGPFLEFIPLASWSFVDSNFFPDFPSNAASGSRSWNARPSANTSSVSLPRSAPGLMTCPFTGSIVPA